MSRNLKFIRAFMTLGLAYTTSVNCMDTKSIEDMLIAAVTTQVPNVDQAKRALDQGANPNDILIGYVHPHAIRDNTVHGKPLLHMALHSAPLTRLLLEYGACPNKVSVAKQRTALHEAAIQGSSHVIPLLLKYGANSSNLARGKSALDFAARSPNIRSLKVLIDALKEKLSEPTVLNLFIAALLQSLKSNYQKAARMLLKELARAQESHADALTEILIPCFFKAVEEGYTELFPLFLEHVDSNYYDKETQKSALDKALEIKDWDKSERVIRSLLSWGAFPRSFGIVKLHCLFKESCDLTLLDTNYNETQVLEEIENLKKFKKSNNLKPEITYSFELFLNNIHRARFSVVRTLFRLKPLPLEQTRIALEHIAFILSLIEKQKNDTTKPLVEECKNLQAALRAHLYGSILLKHIKLSNSTPHTTVESEEAIILTLPLEIWHHILEMRFGFPVRSPSAEHLLYKAIQEQSYRLAQEGIERGALINSRDQEGNTPLHHAAASGNQAIIELLLAHGAKVKAANKLDQTPENSARKNKHDSCAEYLKAAAQSFIPEVPLVKALRERHEHGKIKKLLKGGCEVNFPGNYRRNALDVAYEVGSSFETMQLLVKYGAVSKVGLDRTQWLFQQPQANVLPEELKRIAVHALEGEHNQVQNLLWRVLRNVTRTSVLSYAVTSGNKELVFLLIDQAKIDYDQFKQAFSIAQGLLKRQSLSEEQRENYKLITEKLAMILQALSS